jgi:hypothetical protein
MVTKRLRHEDYLKEYRDIIKNSKSLSTRVTYRILQLCKIHPEAPVVGDLMAGTLTGDYLNQLDVETRLMILWKIEKYSTEKENVVQLKI